MKLTEYLTQLNNLSIDYLVTEQQGQIIAG